MPPAFDAKQAEALVDATAPLLGIAIDPSWRAAVVANVVGNAAIATNVMDFALDDEAEPAPVFTP